MKSTRFFLLAVAAGALLLFAACGGSGERGQTGENSSSAEPVTQQQQQESFTGELGIPVLTAERDAGAVTVELPADREGPAAYELDLPQGFTPSRVTDLSSGWGMTGNAERGWYLAALEDAPQSITLPENARTTSDWTPMQDDSMLEEHGVSSVTLKDSAPEKHLVLLNQVRDEPDDFLPPAVFGRADMNDDGDIGALDLSAVIQDFEPLDFSRVITWFGARHSDIKWRLGDRELTLDQLRGLDGIPPEEHETALHDFVLDEAEHGELENFGRFVEVTEPGGEKGEVFRPINPDNKHQEPCGTGFLVAPVEGISGSDQWPRLFSYDLNRDGRVGPLDFSKLVNVYEGDLNDHFMNVNYASDGCELAKYWMFSKIGDQQPITPFVDSQQLCAIDPEGDTRVLEADALERPEPRSLNPGEYAYLSKKCDEMPTPDTTGGELYLIIKWAAERGSYKDALDDIDFSG